jgi:hypothetical protein
MPLFFVFWMPCIDEVHGFFVFGAKIFKKFLKKY